MSTTRALHDVARLAVVEMLGLHREESEEAFDRLTELAAQVLQTPMAFFTVLDDTTQFFKSRVGVELESLPVEESFCQYVVDDGQAFVTGRAASNPRSRDNPSIANLGIAAYAGAPVRNSEGHVVGAFCVADGVEREWSDQEIQTLNGLAAVAATEIALRESLQVTAEFASTLQRSLLPPVLPVIPGLDLTARYIPAHDGFGVLGDFYDVFPVGPDRWVLMIGDVRGHGPAAAETVSLTRWALRAEAARTESPSEMLGRVNALLQARPSLDAPHLTCLVASLRHDAAAVAIEVARAGHPPALLRRPDGTGMRLPEGGPPLGVIDDLELPETTVHLTPGASLILLTDGVTEAGPRDDMLGRTGVDAVLSALPPDASAGAIAGALVDGARERQPGPSPDDIAVVVLQRIPKDADGKG